MPLHRILDRRGKHLAVRHIEAAVALDPRQTGNTEVKVRIRSYDAYFAGTIHQLFELVLFFGFLLPVYAAGREEVILVLLQAHPGFLGGGVGRIACHHPAGMLDTLVHQRLGNLLICHHGFLTGIGHYHGIVTGRDADVDGKRFIKIHFVLGKVLKLLFACLIVKFAVNLGNREVVLHIFGATLQAECVEFLHQGRCFKTGSIDQHHIPFFYLGGIIYKDLGKQDNPWIFHINPFFFTICGFVFLCKSDIVCQNVCLFYSK